MYDKITSEDVTIQIESSSVDNWVPDGIAVSQGIYDLQLVSDPSSVTPMGMNKTGNMSTGENWADVTGWTAMGSLPGTVIDSNESLVIAETGSIMVSISINFSTIYSPTWFFFGTWSSGMVRLIHNDRVVSAKTARSNVTFRKVLNVMAGDKISIQARGLKGKESASYPNLLASGSNIKFEGYDNSAIDFEEGMAFQSDVGFFDDVWGRYVSPSYIKKGLPVVTHSSSSTSTSISGSPDFGYTATSDTTTSLTRGSASGPILAQTKVPIYVEPGAKVTWSGTFRVRRTGSYDEQTEEGTKTGLDVRFSVWGIGVSTDEYGVETITSQEVMFYEVTLQPSSSASTNMIEYTLPTFPEPATVPENVEYLHFTCSLVQTISDIYSAGTFTDTTQGSPKSSSEMKYFGWRHTDPLKITVTPPASVRRVTTHPLSRTGVAYKNPSVFTNVKPNATVTFFGFPGQATSIDVYNYNADTSTRGALIGNYSVASGAVNTVTISPGAGVTAIELVKASANDFYIESVINEVINTLSTLKTPIRESNFISINDDIAKVSSIREEGDTSTLTIDFCSDQLDPFTSDVLESGNIIRVLGRHYDEGDVKRPVDWVGEANYNEIFTGVIRRVTTEYDYTDEPIIQVVCYDAADVLEKSKVGVAFDSYEKYIPILNKMGINVLLNGFNVGGKYGKAPNKFSLRPSSYGEYEMARSIHMIRNTLRGYTFVNRYNQLELLKESKTNAPFVFTDGSLAGDISYGRISKKKDTNAIVNQLELNENTLDADDYRSQRIGGEDGPPGDIRYPSEKKRTATFTNETSVQEYGEITRSFEVVRGSGDLNKLYRNDLGEGFTEWATVLLDQNGIPLLQIEDITVPIKSSDDIRKVSQLELLDNVTIIYKGVSYSAKIREIEHTIIPGKWFVEFKFVSSGDQTLW